MSDLTNDRSTEYQEGLFEDLPVAAGQKIYAGAAVGLASNGYAGGAAGSTYTDFRGRAEAQVDNTDGSNGDLSVRVRRGPVLKWDAAGLSDPSDVGAEVFFTDDHTVSTTPGLCFAGKILSVESTTSCFVDHRPAFFAGEARQQLSHVADPAATASDIDDQTGGSADESHQIAAPDALTAADPTADAAEVTAADPTADAAEVTAADPTADAAEVTATDPTLDASDITDNSGGADPEDHTIPAFANTDTLTNSTGGSSDDTLAAVTQQAGGAGVELTDGDAAKINDNFTEVADQLATQKTHNAATANAFALVAAEYNSLKDDVEANETAVEALVDDVTSIRAAVVANNATAEALVDDVTSIRAAVAANNVTAEALVDDLTALRASIITAFATVAAEHDTLKDDVEANNTAIDSILSTLETLGFHATS